jgi:predicted transcriptional regulator of viral defense system
VSASCFVHRSEKSYNTGIEQQIINGVSLNIYSPEKTIADCFKYRNQLGTDLAVEALKKYLSRKNAKPAEVLRMAKICRVEKVIYPYMEALV